MELGIRGGDENSIGQVNISRGYVLVEGLRSIGVILFSFILIGTSTRYLLSSHQGFGMFTAPVCGNESECYIPAKKETERLIFP